MNRLVKYMIFTAVAVLILANGINFSAIELTDSEKNFIENNPVIKIGMDPEFVPFEFWDGNGNYVGITADYLALISETTGLQFEVVRGLTWGEAYNQALKGDIDLLPAVSKTSDREKSFLFTDPYYYFQRVIVVGEDENDISGLESITDLTVAVQENSSHHSYLLNYPEVNLSLYQSVEGALAAVARKDERAFVGNMATINYIIKSRGITGLKIERFREDERFALHMAVRQDMPELVSIINKGLATITEQEKLGINSKWIDLDTSYDFEPIIRILTILGVIVAIIFAISTYWIFKLRKEIQKRIEIEKALLQAKQDAIIANQTKSNFLARMSHEIRTPLNAITGMAYLMKKMNLSLAQKQYINKIVQASNNMLQIINDILDFSKIEAGKIELEMVPFNLDRVFQDVVNIISYKAEEQDVQLSFEKDPDLPTFYIGDPIRLQQILLNLVNNAVKFTNHGEVRLEVHQKSGDMDQVTIAFIVKDTGIGMSESQIEQLFEPFTQADSSINRRFGGTGLGLPIVKSLVELMNGTLNVSSAENIGTDFMVEIPLTIDQAKETQQVLKKDAVSLGKIKSFTLVKTSELENQLKMYLTAFGLHSEFSTSYNAFCNILGQDSTFDYDLLIFDYDIIAEENWEFLRKIRLMQKNLKIILLVPMLREDLFDQLDALSIDLGIGKPIIPSVLYDGLIELFKENVFLNDTANQELSSDRIGEDIVSGTLLLVEDNKTNQFIAQTILTTHNHQVIVAENGRQGVDLFNENRQSIDLILMDLHMPIMNGYDASAAIRMTDSEVPIMAMTADAISGIKEQCEMHGINHYISKPFDPDDLLNRIQAILKSKGFKNNGSPVINRADGMKYTGNNEALYAKILHSFYNESKDTVSDLQKALLVGDYESARQIVHKIKGTTGTIGATKVYDLSKKLQQAIEQEDKIEVHKRFEEFAVLFKQLIDEIERS